MEIRHQSCLACHSKTLENIIVREAGRTQAIYVRCATCHQFVARYLLKDYYHHGRTLDSLLQSTGQSLESGREMLAEMKEREETAVRQFTKVIKTLELPEEPADQQIDS
jgi:hypothetical protein